MFVRERKDAIRERRAGKQRGVAKAKRRQRGETSRGPIVAVLCVLSGFGPHRRRPS